MELVHEIVRVHECVDLAGRPNPQGKADVVAQI